MADALDYGIAIYPGTFDPVTNGHTDLKQNSYGHTHTKTKWK